MASRGETCHHKWPPGAADQFGKVLWPGAGYAQGALLKYLISVYPYPGPTFPRPLVCAMAHWDWRKSFYQKNAPAHTPDWVETFSWKTSRGRTINYILCNNLETLVWLGNQACLEYHLAFFRS